MELKEVQITKTIWIRNDGYIKCTAHNAKYKNVWRESKFKDYVMLDKDTRIRFSRLMAQVFIPKTNEDIELGRDIVDHITHNPVDMNINDVRNLRWCTRFENDHFPEAHENKSKAQKGSKKPKVSKAMKKLWEVKKQCHRQV